MNQTRKFLLLCKFLSASSEEVLTNLHDFLWSQAKQSIINEFQFHPISDLVWLITTTKSILEIKELVKSQCKGKDAFILMEMKCTQLGEDIDHHLFENVVNKVLQP